MSRNSVLANAGATSDLRVGGFDGHVVHRWFHRGNGTGSARKAVQAWCKVAEHHDDATAAINGAVTALGSSWRGHGVVDVIAPILREVEESAVDALAAARALDAQIAGFHDAQSRIVDVPLEPPRLSVTTPINPITPPNFAVANAKHVLAVQANQEALHAYAVATEANLAQLPDFGPPPSIVDETIQLSRPDNSPRAETDTATAGAAVHERRGLFRRRSGRAFGALRRVGRGGKGRSDAD